MFCNPKSLSPYESPFFLFFHAPSPMCRQRIVYIFTFIAYVSACACGETFKLGYGFCLVAFLTLSKFCAKLFCVSLLRVVNRCFHNDIILCVL